MLCPSNIHVNWQPFARQRRVPRLCVVIRGGIAQEVPGGVQEVVVDIGLPSRGPSTDGAGGIHEAFNRCQRGCSRSRWFPVFHIRQQHRQLLFGHRHCSMFGTIDDGNGWSPVTLPTDQPVPQTIFDAALTYAPLPDFGNDGLSRFSRGHTRKLSGIDQHARLHKCFPLYIRVSLDRAYNYFDRQMHCMSKLPISLIMSWYTHNRASSVAAQYKIGYIDRDAFAREGMQRISSCEDARHGALICLGQAFGLLLICIHGIAIVRLCNLLDQWMTRCQSHEGDTKNCIRPCGVDLDMRFWHIGNPHSELQPIRTPDPVAL